ncbi:MAG: methyltransferase domain-containing protein, partial [Thermoleophilaceae bacterium]|nr:methyltransferase domain-containing protein [Thermoleophilaceae bacterium]
MAFDPAEIKQRQRIMWSSGNYPEIAQTIEGVAELVVERVGVKAGHDMLDVATGSGNVAIPAADLGAHVVGLDLTPELFVVARERAANAGVEVNWVEGDAEDLPFGDDSFDRVTSVFGAIFAPRHQQAASEIVRVCKPGGRFAIAAWTPEGLNGQMF